MFGKRVNQVLWAALRVIDKLGESETLFPKFNAFVMTQQRRQWSTKTFLPLHSCRGINTIVYMYVCVLGVWAADMRYILPTWHLSFVLVLIPRIKWNGDAHFRFAILPREKLLPFIRRLVLLLAPRETRCKTSTLREAMSFEKNLQRCIFLRVHFSWRMMRQ
jgi:hypothetical protein